MLNYETILSSYDDRLTLLQWLKKVEAALANASFENFQVVDLGNATYKFVASFADGSEIESNEIRIGERISSAYIGAGNTLHLVTESGDDIDAGAMFNGGLNVSGNVSAAGNINANGDLAVVGKITGAPIIENMDSSQYRYEHRTATTENETYFSGIVKNGNKITFVVVGKLTTTTLPNSGAYRIGSFFVPPEIFDALVNTTYPGGAQVVSSKLISMFKNVNQAVETPFRLTKEGNYLPLSIITSGLVNNTEYAYRYEETFLLCDDMTVDN